MIYRVQKRVQTPRPLLMNPILRLFPPEMTKSQKKAKNQPPKNPQMSMTLIVRKIRANQLQLKKFQRKEHLR